MMVRFSYKAKKNPQQVVEGVVEAEHLQQAVKKISALGHTPFEIRPCEDILEDKGHHSFLNRIPRRCSLQWLRSLSDLLDAHIPVPRALMLAKDQTHLPLLSRKVEKMTQIVQDGGALSDALAAFSEIFPAHYIPMVKSGELGGNLNEVLNRLALDLERQQEMRRKFLSALLYPAFIVAVGFLSLIILLTWVIPQLSTILADLDQKLPWITVAFLSLSHFCVRWGWAMASVAVLAVAVGMRMYATASGRLKFDQKILHVPMVGPWFKTRELGEFLRTLAMLTTSGIALVPALEASCTVVRNQHLAQKMRAMVSDVRRGTSFSQAVSAAQIFPDADRTMMAVGEEAGTLSESLAKLASHYERRLDEKMRLVMSLLEPALILVVGLMVGAVILAFLVPMMSIHVR